MAWGGLRAVYHKEHAERCEHLLVIAVALVGLDNDQHGCPWVSKLRNCCSDCVRQVRCHIVLGKVAEHQIWLPSALHNVAVQSAHLCAEAAKGGGYCVELYLQRSNVLLQPPYLPVRTSWRFLGASLTAEGTPSH